METKACAGRCSKFSARSRLSVLPLLLGGACAGDPPSFGQTDETVSDGNQGGEADASVDATSTNSGTDVRPGEGAPVACPAGCLIEDRCYSDGETNGNNSCQVCDVMLSAVDWSNADGKSCSDGMYCTVDDYCSGGVCIGDERVCDDGVACNGAETCDEETSQCVGARSICAAGQLCDVARDTCSADCVGCVIDGSCYAEGSQSPTNPCLACNSAVANDQWSAQVGDDCDDGDLCTEGDVCHGTGQCVGAEVECVDDNEVCGAKRSCDPGTGMCADQYPGTSVACNDMDTCTSNDRCDGAGQCVGTPSADPSGGCDCVTNSDCDDGVPCTTDTCSDGACTSVVAAGKCRIEGACYDQGDPDPTNGCRVCDSANKTAWSYASPSTSCDDGLWCNGDNDTCDGRGECSHTFPNSNRCATTTGACEVQTCDESKKNCYAPAGEVCEETTVTGCAMGETCSAHVYTWPVQYACSGTSANCGTTPNARQDLATVKETCGSAEACQESSDSCQPKLGCDITYCKDDLCWTKVNAPVTGNPTQYTQNDGRLYCSGLDYAGREDWRLPTVAEMQTLVEGPSGGCYWPAAMGACTDELWTTDEAMSFAFWVGTTALQVSSTPLYVRCVVNE